MSIAYWALSVLEFNGQKILCRIPSVSGAWRGSHHSSLAFLFLIPVDSLLPWSDSSGLGSHTNDPINCVRFISLGLVPMYVYARSTHLPLLETRELPFFSPESIRSPAITKLQVITHFNMPLKLHFLESAHRHQSHPSTNDHCVIYIRETSKDLQLACIAYRSN